MTDERPWRTAEVSSVLAALAHPIRRRMLELLDAEGEVTATALADGLPISRQAVAKHLSVLGDAGLVTRTRTGREVRFVMCPAALEAAAEWIGAHASDWDRRLARLKRIAEAAARDSG